MFRLAGFKEREDYFSRKGAVRKALHSRESCAGKTWLSKEKQKIEVLPLPNQNWQISVKILSISNGHLLGTHLANYSQNLEEFLRQTVTAEFSSTFSNEHWG